MRILNENVFIFVENYVCVIQDYVKFIVHYMAKRSHMGLLKDPE